MAIPAIVGTASSVGAISRAGGSGRASSITRAAGAAAPSIRLLSGGGTLRRELLAAGFARVEIVPHVLPRRFSRDEALAKLRGRAYSTFVHLSDVEYEAGLAAAEAGLPPEVGYELRLLNVLAVTPPARAPSASA